MSVLLAVLSTPIRVPPDLANLKQPKPVERLAGRRVHIAMNPVVPQPNVRRHHKCAVLPPCIACARHHQEDRDLRVFEHLEPSVRDESTGQGKGRLGLGGDSVLVGFSECFDPSLIEEDEPLVAVAPTWTVREVNQSRIREREERAPNAASAYRARS